MNVFDRLYFSLNMLIDISEETQNKIARNKESISPLAYVKKFCTISIKTSRKAGHTSAIKKIINEREFINPIILCPNYSMCKFYKDISEKARCMTVDTFLKGGYTSDAIFCDCSSFLSANQIENIYLMAMVSSINSKSFFLVFVE